VADDVDRPADDLGADLCHLGPRRYGLPCLRGRRAKCDGGENACRECGDECGDPDFAWARWHLGCPLDWSP
jgi:hypothetical protein